MSALDQLRKAYPEDFDGLNDFQAVSRVAKQTGKDVYEVGRQFGVEMPTIGRELLKGVSSAIDQTQGSLYGLGALGADLVGAERVRDWAMEGAKRNQQEAQLAAPAVGDIRDIDGVHKGGLWAAHTLGSAVAQLPMGLAPAAVGTVLPSRSW